MIRRAAYGQNVFECCGAMITRCNEPITTPADALSPALVRKMHAYWRASNYLSVGQIYLYDNPLLKSRLQREHLKPRLFCHWGTTPGLNFVYIHLNRVVRPIRGSSRAGPRSSRSGSREPRGRG